MERSEIIDKVRNVVSEKLGIPEYNLKMTQSFKGELGADSLDEIEMLMMLEDEFDLEITDEEGQLLTNILKTVDYVENNI